MPKDVRIAPSVLSADFMRLADELASVATADYIHYDVMDGHFVPQISFGPGILSQVKGATELPVDVHLMVTNPDEAVDAYLEAGADVVTFHAECVRHGLRVVDEIHAAGRLASVAINPGTSVDALDALVSHVDMVLVMSVNPGFGGQRFIESTYRQLDRLRDLCREQGAHPLVEVDGGVGAGNAGRLAEHGANVLVAGSAVFGRADRAAAIAELRAAALAGVPRRA